MENRPDPALPCSRPPNKSIRRCGRGGYTKLQPKNYQYSCRSERSAASLRISAALEERFFAGLKMTKNSLLIAFWFYTISQSIGGTGVSPVQAQA
jgi:hypothetical protein